MHEIESEHTQTNPIEEPSFIDPLTCNRLKFTLMVIRCPAFNHLSGPDLEDLIEKMIARARIISQSSSSQE